MGSSSVHYKWAWEGKGHEFTGCINNMSEAFCDHFLQTVVWATGDPVAVVDQTLLTALAGLTG